MAANVAIQSLSLAESRAEQTELFSIEENDQHNIKLVQAALEAGSATQIELLTAQSQLATDRILLPDLKQRESISRHVLSVLVGSPVADWQPPEFVLDSFTVPNEIPLGIPSELLRRRPDILAAEARLRVASAAVGAATARLYPNLTITGGMAQEALTPAKLFAGGANIWNVVANLTFPIFDGGALRAQRDAAVSEYKAAVADYQQVVLNAFREVSDRLQAIKNDSDSYHDMAIAEEIAANRLDLARKGYAIGGLPFFDVLDAERVQGKLKLDLSRIRAQRLADTVLLFCAVGLELQPH